MAHGAFCRTGVTLCAAWFAALFFPFSQARAEIIADVDPVGAPAAFWGAFMEGQIGAYDSTQRCWSGPLAEEDICFRPHRLETITFDGTNRHYVVVEGGVWKDGERLGCHACGGVALFYELRTVPDGVEIVSRTSEPIGMGSWGSVPPEDSFQLVELGPRGLFGWAIEHGYTGQGYTCGGIEFVAPLGRSFVENGSVPNHSDNAGACDPDMFECTPYNHSYDLIVDSSVEKGGRYELLLRRTRDSFGNEDGALPEFFRVPFDGDSLTYKPSEAIGDKLSC